MIADKVPAIANDIENRLPATFCNTDRRENRSEVDDGRLKFRMRTMRVLRSDREAGDVIHGFANIWNLLPRHKELGIESVSVDR